MEQDFDALVEASRAGQNKMGEQALWRAALTLDRWFLIGNAEGEQTEPICGMVDGHAHLIAFTDEDRANDFAKRRAASGEHSAGSVLHMDVADAIEYLRQLDEAGVAGVLFNSGAYSFSQSMVRIVDMHGRCAG